VCVIGRFPGQTSCVTLVFGVLSRAAAGWRGLASTPQTARDLAALRHRLFEPPRQPRPDTAITTDTEAMPMAA